MKYIAVIRQNGNTINCKDCNSYKEAVEYIKSLEEQSFDWIIHRIAQSYTTLPVMKNKKLLDDKEKTRERVDKIYSIEEVHSLFDKWEEEFGSMAHRQHDRISTTLDGFPVKTWSQRYAVFRNNTKCAVCGMEATHYRLERQIGAKNYHFNLYGMKDEEEILFTKDHILPVSKGGKNTMDNYQTMCQICNQEKADQVEISTGVYKSETRTTILNPEKDRHNVLKRTRLVSLNN